MAEVDNADMLDVENAAPEQAKEEAEGAKTMVGGIVELDDAQLPLFVSLVASIVLLIATTSHYENYAYLTSYGNYVISVSCIAMILSFSTLVLNKFNQAPGEYEDGATNMYDKAGESINLLNFAWSFVGACFLTFKEPFTSTGNGYFAAWVLAFSLAFVVGMSAKEVRHRVKQAKAVTGLLAASLVVVVATIPPIRDGTTSYDPNVPTDPNMNVNDYKGEASYALALACVSLAFVLLQMFLEKKSKELKGKAYLGVMAILAACWIVSACLVTFRGPFVVTGNGYFASWVGAGMSSMATFAAKKALEE